MRLVNHIPRFRGPRERTAFMQHQLRGKVLVRGVFWSRMWRLHRVPNFGPCVKKNSTSPQGDKSPLDRI